MLSSLAEQAGSSKLSLGCYDLGLSSEQRAWLAERKVQLVAPQTRLRLPSGGDNFWARALLTRLFLREDFPGYDVYAWFDADLWFQDLHGVNALIDTACAHGAAIVHETERGYRFQDWLFEWTATHFMKGYGLVLGLWLLTRPHLNAGLFAFRADAPHWKRWRESLQQAIDRTGEVRPYDQFALNAAIYMHNLPTAFLAPPYNWICDRGIPMWNEAIGTFCVPYPPYRPISVMHLAGPAKREIYDVPTINGGSVRASLRHPRGRRLAAHGGASTGGRISCPAEPAPVASRLPSGGVSSTLQQNRAKLAALLRAYRSVYPGRLGLFRKLARYGWRC
ncbi:MAG TPA: hypothetical protein VJT33_06960 [bacterium]|nr:hypothetical protein [bacterium]